jgi:hypothetical protein
MPTPHPVRSRRLLLCLAILTALAGRAAATTLQGKVEEVKTPASGLEGVEVTVCDATHLHRQVTRMVAEGSPPEINIWCEQPVWTALTGPDGSYRIPNLPSGSAVAVIWSKVGYKQYPTLLEKLSLTADVTEAPEVPMMEVHGDAQHFVGVASAMNRRVSAHPEEAEALLGLVMSLPTESQAIVRQNLQPWAVRITSLPATPHRSWEFVSQPSSGSAAAPSADKTPTTTSTPPPPL